MNQGTLRNRRGSVARVEAVSTFRMVNVLIVRVAAGDSNFTQDKTRNFGPINCYSFQVNSMAVAEPQIRKAEFHEIYVRNDRSAWCKLLWQDNGWVIILSDYGHWAYWWGHRGEGVSVAKFLAGLDRDYMGNKMMGQSLMEFSLESTVQAIRETIIFERKSCGMEKEEARSEWELAERLEDGDLSFEGWYGESSMVDGYECQRKEVCGTWSNFWDRLWVPMVVPVLKSEYE